MSNPVRRPGETDAARAYDIYRLRGVVSPDFADEIAERRRVASEWADAGCPIQ